MIGKEKAQEIAAYHLAHGKSETMKAFGYSEETLNRFLREAKKYGLPEIDKSRLLSQIADTYSETELKAIANGGRIVPGMTKVPVIDFEGERIRIGNITDTHIGSTQFSDQRLYQAFDEFRKEKVDFITHSGDVTEGMSNRPGHVYELSHIGYDRQKEYALELFSQWADTDVYMISGNHDLWFLKSSGAMVVKDIASALDNYHYIGDGEGDISLKGQATLKLWHGEDGNSYALSYRLQKIAESLSGGEKPNAMICGHTHKYVKIFERNIWIVSAGSIQAQTQWMRGKRIAAHVGFCIMDLWVNKSGISKMRETWYPFYT